MHCLICYSYRPKQQHRYSETNKNFEQLSTVDKHLYIIFILRKVLQVSTEQLELFLEAYPKIENWFGLCEKCTETVHRCQTAYQQVLEAVQAFKALQEDIVERVKITSKNGSSDKVSVKMEINPEDDFIVNASRQFVVMNEYPEFFDPFIVGDSLAKKQLSNYNPFQTYHSANDSVPVVSSFSLPDQLYIKQEHYFQSFGDNPDIHPEVHYSDSEDEDTTTDYNVSTGSQQTFLTNAYAENGVKSLGQKLSKQTDRSNSTYKIRKTKNRKSKSSNKHKCRECGKIYSSIYSLAIHRQLHTNADKLPFICNICGTRFPRKDYLNCHRLKVHTIGKVGVNICPVRQCNAVFSTSRLLEQHMGTHPESPKLSCDTCGEKYYLKYALFRHTNFHVKGLTPPKKLAPLETKIFKDTKPKKGPKGPWKHKPIVDKSSTDNGKLSISIKAAKEFQGNKRGPKGPWKHKRTGNGPKFRCNVCGKGDFKYSVLLKKHLADKHNIFEAPIKRCEWPGCNKILYERFNARVHMAKHRKEPLFGCQACGIQFYYRHHLQRHMTTKTHLGVKINKGGRPPKHRKALER